MNDTQPQVVAPTAKRLWRLWAVIVAGEAIFVLPFVIPRLFRPTLLRHWDLDHTTLNLAMSLYGIVAAAAYFLGGPLADRYPPRRLMVIALLATAAIGLGMLSTPGPITLGWVYAGFGMTTILLFWAAMIRVTHDIGGRGHRGASFGILDAGRGLFAVLLAAAMVEILTIVADEFAVKAIIALGVSVVVAAAIAVGCTLRQPARVTNHLDAPEQPFRLGQVATVCSQPAVWLQGGVLLFAYVGYKTIDYFGSFATEVHGLDEVTAARLTQIVFWLRPLAALAAGIGSDRRGGFGILAGLFFVMAAAAAWLMIGATSSWTFAMLLCSVGAIAAAVYAMRAVYFAVFDSLDVKPRHVGTAAGIVSTVGFLPDIFFGPVAGYLIDNHPGPTGYRYLFATVAVCGIAGMAISLWQLRSRRPSFPTPD